MSARESASARLFATTCLAGAWFAAVAAAPASPHLTPQSRVAAIGYRLAAAGVARCPRRAPLTGLRLHDLGAYDEVARESVARQSGLTDGMGVMEALAGSPAQQAGLVGGDEIVALNDAAVTTLGLPRQGRVASYARVEAFTGLLDAALARGGAWLTVRRSGANRRVFIALREGCAVRFVMLPGRKAAAWSDERYAAASEALAKDAGESELAFALAHEMAHVVLGHAEAERPPLASLGFGGAKTRAREREADELGILISLDAGYDVEGAEALLQRLTRAQTGISLTHPSLTERMVAIRRVADTALKTRHAGDP